jgi:hypothetical protein
MNDGPSAGRQKLFTVEEANAALPLVQAIVKDVVRVSHDIVERRERLCQVRAGRKPTSGDLYAEELAQTEQDLEQERARLYEFAGELRELGVELKDGLIGLVDFPSRVDDRIVYLCWKLGEPEVLHWHELDEGFSGRKSLTADIAANGGAGTERDDRNG